MDDVIDWAPLQPFGATVRLDLRGEVGEAQIARLRELFDSRHLLVFPGQSLSAGDQLRVAGWFGPVAQNEEVGGYSTDPAMGELGAGELAFHSDLSCTPEPLQGISLHALAVEERSSVTVFVDAIAAARRLPAELRARLAGLHVMNLWPRSLSQRQRRADAPPGWPGTAHPILKPHPRTGEPIVYCNASHSDRVVELAEPESECVIQDLFARLYAPANRYEHHWRPAVPPGVVRTLQRVEIGSRSYEDLMPPELMAAYAQE